MNEIKGSTTIDELLSELTWGSTGENDDEGFSHRFIKDMTDRHIRYELARWEHKMKNIYRAAFYMELALREQGNDQRDQG